MTIVVSIVITLAAVGVGCGLFYAGRWFERRRLTGLVAWAQEEVDAATLAMIEAAGLQAGSLPEESEARVH